MDNKTMQKVINGQEDKIQELSQIVLLLDKKIKELDGINAQQSAKITQKTLFFQDKIQDLSIRIDDKIYSKIAVDGKIEVLEQYAKEQTELALNFNDDKIKELNKKISTINHKIVKYGLNADKLEKNQNYKKLWQENTDDYNFLACKRLEDYTKGIKNSESIDNLESKYYKLRSELDSIYKVLEMDALDIQDLYNKIDKHPKNKGDNNE